MKTTSFQITREEFQSRADKLLAHIQQEKLSGVVLFDNFHILYYSGFAFIPTERPIAWLMNAKGEHGMYVPRLELEHAKANVQGGRVDHYLEYPDIPHPMHGFKTMLSEMGFNGSRCWLWKLALQLFADEFGLTLTVTHYPPSASPWNWMEHRLVNAISCNWAGQPRGSYETVLTFMRTTQTASGLHCVADLDTHAYPTKLKVSPAQQASIHRLRQRVWPQWNYTIKPHTASSGK